ncbi:MAG TPA: response regulator transcription factor [Candidatus Paceibacterota bacterium]
MRILIVDDEQAVRDMLTETLRSEGFVVDSASDGEKGSYLARSNDYDAIVLDNRMPKKAGIDVVKEIRADGKQTPILILSVLQEPQQKVELLNAGADDYLVKPYSFEELVARIHALLRRPAGIEGDILTIGDLSLDTKKYTARRGKDELSLTRKEFALLAYLMRHPGVVLTRGRLIEHVWDMEVDPFSNTIESHIASLRRKIEARGKRRLIRTVSGRGYKIEA